MTVKARFKVQSILDLGEQKNVKLTPITSGKGNESFSKYTPCGSIEMTITNPVAFNQFVVGKTYDIDFNEYVEPVAEEAQAEAA